MRGPERRRRRRRQQPRWVTAAMRGYIVLNSWSSRDHFSGQGTSYYRKTTHMPRHSLFFLSYLFLPECNRPTQCLLLPTTPPITGETDLNHSYKRTISTSKTITEIVHEQRLKEKSLVELWRARKHLHIAPPGSATKFLPQ